MRLLILGNCQAQLLEHLFSLACEGVVVDGVMPVFQATQADSQDFESKMVAADLILAQRVDSAFGLEWLTTASLRRRFGHKLIVWPNIYFDGYFPGVRYLYQPTGQKVSSPLEDYHFEFVLRGFRSGASVSEICDIFESGPQPPEPEPFASSFNQLRSREADCDVLISDYLEQEVNHRRCFYTPNHPARFVIVEMCRRLAKRAGLTFSEALSDAFDVHLNRIYISTYPWVRKQYALNFDQAPIFRGLAVESVGPDGVVLGAQRDYFFDELVEQWYKIYSVLGT